MIISDLIDYIACLKTIQEGVGLDSGSINTELKTSNTYHAEVKSKIANILHVNDVKVSDDRISIPIPLEVALAPEINVEEIRDWCIPQMGTVPLEKAAAIPARVQQNYIADPVSFASYANPQSRVAILEYLRLTEDETTALIKACRMNGSTITSAITAAMLSVTSFFLQCGIEQVVVDLKIQNLKYIIAVDTRHLGTECDPSSQSSKQDWSNGRVACASHCLEHIMPIPISSITRVKGMLQMNTTSKSVEDVPEGVISDFWDLAKKCRGNTEKGMKNNLGVYARFFEYMINHLGYLGMIDKSAVKPHTMGRDSATGVSNVGIGEFGDLNRCSMKLTDFVLKENYFASGPSFSGSYSFASCQTIRKCLCVTLSFTTPVTTQEEAKMFKKCISVLIQDIIRR